MGLLLGLHPERSLPDCVQLHLHRVETRSGIAGLIGRTGLEMTQTCHRNSGKIIILFKVLFFHIAALKCSKSIVSTLSSMFYSLIPVICTDYFFVLCNGIQNFETRHISTAFYIVLSGNSISWLTNTINFASWDLQN